VFAHQNSKEFLEFFSLSGAIHVTAHAAGRRTRKMPLDSAPIDDDLLRRMRAGDAEAFTAVYRRWQGPLYRFALHMSDSHALAEDATQEVFMTLINKSAQFDAGRGALGAFLFGIARNKVRRRQERERAYISITGPSEDSSGAAAIAENRLQQQSQDDPARVESIERVRQAILALPEDFREVVALCDLEEMSYEEAAAALGCAVGTVASRLHRARGLLAARLRKSQSAARKPRFTWNVRKVGNV
jgi:RNA polymerase sigma-70 factor (ECF subfamily)